MNGLRELRHKHLLTQRDVAERSGLTVTTINRIENGRESPSFVTIRKLAGVFDLPPTEMAAILAENG